MSDDLFGSTSSITSNFASSDPQRGSIPDVLLTNAIKADRLGTTLLFYGAEGVGKWRGAMGLARFLNCSVRDNSSALTGACGKCASCLVIDSGNHPDILIGVPLPSHKTDTEEGELFAQFMTQKREDPYRIVRWDRAATLTIDKARDIRSRLSRRSSDNVVRVVVLYQLERMRPEGMDSLLRMIEEPPARTVFVLVTNNPDALSATTLSRCQRIRFPRWSTNSLEDFLAAQPHIPSHERATISRLAQGSPGLALELAGQFHHQDSDETSDREIAWLAFKALFLENSATSLDIVNRNLNFRSRATGDILIDRWQSFLRDLLAISQGAEEVVVNFDLLPELRRLAGNLTLGETLFELTEKFGILRINMRRNVSASLALADIDFAISRHLKGRTAA